MKNNLHIYSIICLTLLFSSCSTEVLINDFNDDPQTISLHQVLTNYELWYVDINATKGHGEVPFLQKAFTLSFLNGEIFANNNLVGFGSQGDGFGIKIGNYFTIDMTLDTNHILDGQDSFDVFQIDDNTIELYNPYTDTSYFLKGYQRATFDYDFVFYDNIHYFLQEYQVWEKTYTSQTGIINPFDNETYLQFLTEGNDSTFRSSKDNNNLHPNTINWDYTGIYTINNISNSSSLKTLNLDYDYLENDLFELRVINDTTIELYHPNSNSIYEFTGQNYISFLKVKPSKKVKKRKQKTIKTANYRTPKG